MKVIRQRVFWTVLVIFLGLIGVSPVCAQTIHEIQNLDFGKWAVTANNSSYSITVEPNGSYNNSSKLLMLSPPQQGIYQVTGLPPSSPIGSVTVTMIQPLTGGGQYFDMDNFQVIAPNTDASGNTTLTVGARASTTGNSAPYPDAVYNGTLQLDINM